MSRFSKPYTALTEFIQNRMKMSHVYQPVMLSVLLKGGGSASVSDIAKALLSQDQSQIEYYEEITKNMVGDVLSARNSVVEKVKNGRRVTGFRIAGYEDLSHAEVTALVALCESKVASFIAARGDRIWSHRRKSSGYVSGTLQYEVLKRAKFRCELCGTLDADKALEVDHIVPRNHGGKDDPTNLQALCYSCNAMKRDRDDTDFRGIAESYDSREAGCLFCGLDTSRVIGSNALSLAFRDKFPVTELHTLIIPRRHVADFFDLYQPEINAVHQLLSEMKNQIQKLDQTVTGFNVGVNAGESAGQTVFHCHIHLIPRRTGDVQNPRGGVRGVIAERQSY